MDLQVGRWIEHQSSEISSNIFETKETGENFNLDKICDPSETGEHSESYESNENSNETNETPGVPMIRVKQRRQAPFWYKGGGGG